MLTSAASVDITTRSPVGLIGHASHGRPFQGVRDPLEATVLVVRQGQSTAALVSCDLLFVGDALRKGVEAKVGHLISPERLFMAASHTHCAPMTQRGMPLAMDVDEGYVARCVDAISGCLLGCVEELVPARLSFRCGRAPHGWSINRRLKRVRVSRHGWSHQAGFGPNPAGPVDPLIRTICVEEETGGPIAILWNYACHPTSLPAGAFVSAEYPGRVRAELRGERPRLPVLFFQGFAGDIRPPFQQRPASARAVLRRVLEGPSFGTPGETEREAWLEAMIAAVWRAVELGAETQLSPALACGRATVDLAEFTDGEPGAGVITVHIVQLARELVLVGVSAEPLVGLRGVVERCVAPRVLVPIGYIDQVPCYLPTDADLPLRGYEVDGFRLNFGMNARFQGGIDAALERVVREAMQAAKLPSRGSAPER